MSWIRAHLTYANVVATICLFLVLSGGTAVALTGSNTVFSDDIVNDQVASVDVRNDTLTRGGLTAADLRPDSVGSSEVKSDSLTGANVDESSFGAVPEASHAVNSDRLGGRAASGYQRRVSGVCDGGAIRAINGDGAVDCIDQAVFPISADLTGTFGGGFGATTFPPSQLRLDETCGSNNVAGVRFTNLGSGGATLNWMFSQGGTSSTVNASGTSLPAAGQGQNFISFNFSNRVEGQWIFADGAGVTTVHLHGFIGPGDPTFCEFKGTAEWAPTG
jgi:hypothetical protein